MGLSWRRIFDRRHKGEEIGDDGVVERSQEEDVTVPISKKKSGLFSARSSSKTARKEKGKQNIKKAKSSPSLQNYRTPASGNTGQPSLSRASSLSSTDIHYLSQARNSPQLGAQHATAHFTLPLSQAELSALSQTRSHRESPNRLPEQSTQQSSSTNQSRQLKPEVLDELAGAFAPRGPMLQSNGKVYEPNRRELDALAGAYAPSVGMSEWERERNPLGRGRGERWG